MLRVHFNRSAQASECPRFLAMPPSKDGHAPKKATGRFRHKKNWAGPRLLTRLTPRLVKEYYLQSAGGIAYQRQSDMGREIIGKRTKTVVYTKKKTSDFFLCILFSCVDHSQA